MYVHENDLLFLYLLLPHIFKCNCIYVVLDAV
jgi:hypothetical protein